LLEDNISGSDGAGDIADQKSGSNGGRPAENNGDDTKSLPSDNTVINRNQNQEKKRQSKIQIFNNTESSNKEMMKLSQLDEQEIVTRLGAGIQSI